jgi:histidinol-phosphate/aromatic aminotransferase/cobyric acid decarboxylase-like protein
MYIKHLQDKTLPDSNRYIRIASRTETENCKLAEALAGIIDSNRVEVS